MLFKRLINLNTYWFFNLVLCLLPLTLISGSFLSDLSVVLLSFITIYYLLKNSIGFEKKLLFFFLIWCFYLIIISILSNNVFNSLESSLFYFRFGLFSWAVCFLISKNNQLLKYLMIVLNFSFLILIFDSFFQLIFGYNIVGIIHEGDRLSSFFGDEHVLGQYLVKFLPILLMLNNFFLRENNALNIYQIFLISNVGIVITASGERTSLGLFVISIIILFLLMKKNNQYFLISLVIFIIISCLIIIVNEPLKKRIIDTSYSQLNIKNSQIHIFSDQHERHFMSAIKMIKDKPLFGIGPKNFRIECNNEKYYVRDGCSTHPHNILLQLLAETGIVGTIPFLLVVLYITRCYVRQFYNKFFHSIYLYSDFRISILTSIMICICFVLPTGNFFGNWYSVFLYLFLGILLFDKNRKNNNTIKQ